MSSELLAVADIRLRTDRTTRETYGSLGYVTRIDARMLEHVAPHLLQRVRLPECLDRETCAVVVMERLRYQELTLSSQELRIDIPEALIVLREQRDRARRNAWQRVSVLPGINGRSHVMWNGEKLPVSAQASGPHWASIHGTTSPVIILQERIVVLPGTEEDEGVIPSKLHERITRTSTALGKLLGRNS